MNAVNRVMKDEAGRVRVEIDPSCKELIADFEQVLLQGPGKLKKSSNREDSYFRRSHCCLVGETLVRTPGGLMQIKDINAGDYVLTPAGAREVTAAGETKVVEDLIRVDLSSGQSVTATPEHKFLTTRGLVTAGELGYSDEILTGDHPI